MTSALTLALLLAGLQGAASTQKTAPPPPPRASTVTQQTGTCSPAIALSESQQITITYEAGACNGLPPAQLKALMSEVLRKELPKFADANAVKKLTRLLEEAESARAQSAQSTQDVLKAYQGILEEVVSTQIAAPLRRDRLFEYRALTAERTTITLEQFVSARAAAANGNGEPARAFLTALEQNVKANLVLFDRFGGELDGDLHAALDAKKQILVEAEKSAIAGVAAGSLTALEAWVTHGVEFLGLARDTVETQIARLPNSR